MIWAKIKGYSWWPGYITAIDDEDSDSDETNREVRITVNFIGENSHAILPEKAIAEYGDNYAKYSVTNSKLLLKSIKLANKLWNRELAVTQITDENSKI